MRRNEPPKNAGLYRVIEPIENEKDRFSKLFRLSVSLQTVHEIDPLLIGCLIGFAKETSDFTHE
ncbi:hypothetical protein ATM17_22240 [Sphingopyxis macrogoltabida]|uniref:Uncharacterized protein n=1 Tax=Sphingopyxis macrogoltabida TaxID=33050 RepID=A0AAC9FGP2_SPHMC|nr:hypothetical protein LH19_21680 [Sphingopyxis macrogoltabida]AMU91736.1 hypothetical protein ATM17_22240 [Sphingopyxis macrogoltabida]